MSTSKNSSKEINASIIEAEASKKLKREPLEYCSQSCCTRNRVNSYFLADEIDIKFIKLFMAVSTKEELQ